MASFQAKIGWKWPRKRENKNYRSVPTRRKIKNSKRIAKIFRKLENTITDSFQAKIGSKRLTKSENKNYRSVPFLPDAKKKFSERIAKKFRKLKNTIMASFQSKIGWKRMR